MHGGNDDGSVAVLEGSCKSRRGEFQIEVRDRAKKLTPVRDDCVELVAPNLELHVAPPGYWVRSSFSAKSDASDC